MATRPLITVLMPVYNDRALALVAAQSILGQTVTDLELLVVDDGSTDGSTDCIYDLGDTRIRVISLDSNRGITTALNTGLDAARGKFIARMDADDYCEPNRLELQLARMQAEPDLVVLGSARRLVDEEGKTIAISQPALDDISIRWRLLLGSPLAHPTVMIRRDALENHKLRYDENFPAAEDYELWTRLLSVGAAANLPEPLLHYRLRNGISRSRRTEQLATHDRIAYRACRTYLPGFAINPPGVRELRGRFGGVSVREPDMQQADSKWVTTYARMFGAFIAQMARSASEDSLNAFAADQGAAIGRISRSAA